MTYLYTDGSDSTEEKQMMQKKKERENYKTNSVSRQNGQDLACAWRWL